MAQAVCEICLTNPAQLCLHFESSNKESKASCVSCWKTFEQSQELIARVTGQEFKVTVAAGGNASKHPSSVEDGKPCCYGYDFIRQMENEAAAAEMLEGDYVDVDADEEEEDESCAYCGVPTHER